MERLHFGARQLSLRKLASRFELTHAGLARHMHNHVSAEVKAAYLAGEKIIDLGDLILDESSSVLHHYALVRNRLYKHFDLAGESNDRLNIDRLAGRLHENFLHTAKVSGELQKSPLLVQQNNYLSSPDAARVVAAVVSAVSPFLEARNAVTKALRALDGPVIEHDAAD